MQIFVIRSDGSGLKQLTKAVTGNHLWPSFLSNKRILFASSVDNGKYAEVFNIFAVNIDGSNLEQVFSDSQTEPIMKIDFSGSSNF